MDYKIISQLIDKYFEGETSLQEESLLRKYFTEEEITGELKAYQPLFQYFAEEQELSLDEQFDQKLIDRLNAGPQRQPISLYSYIMRVAAVVVLVAGTFWLIQTTANEKAILAAQEKEQAKQAYNQAMEALMLVSTKLNEGKSKAAKEMVKVEKLSKIIKK